MTERPGVKQSEGITPARDVQGRLLPGHSGNPGGLPRAIAKARRLLTRDAPAAARLLRQLMASEDEKIQLAAACEILDRTAGKPKPMDTDTSAIVKAELSAIFARLRASLSPEVYQRLVAEVLEGSK